MVRVFLVFVGCILAAGCNDSLPTLDQPVSVNGKVTTRDGKPAGGVAVKLQPLENGYEKVINVDSDGLFKVETHAGKYAYYFAPKAGSKTTPPQFAKYQEANMARTVVITSGQDVAITLD